MANSVDPEQTAPCSLFWVHTICFYTLLISNVRQLFAADDFSRRHFQMHFFLGALRVKSISSILGLLKTFFFLLNPFTAIYKCTQYAEGKYGFFDYIMVLHIISYKIITLVGIYTKFFF